MRHKLLFWDEDQIKNCPFERMKIIIIANKVITKPHISSSVWNLVLFQLLVIDWLQSLLKVTSRGVNRVVMVVLEVQKTNNGLSRWWLSLQCMLICTTLANAWPAVKWILPRKLCRFSGRASNSWVIDISFHRLSICIY
jgi:hypothetical protein